MKNTIAGASFSLASVVCVILLANLVRVQMFPSRTVGNVTYASTGDDGVYMFGVGFLLVAGFVYLCLAVYYFNSEDKPSP